MSNDSQHLKALLKKNWILWKRNIFCSLVEILLPFLICIATMSTFRNNIDKTSMPIESYINEPMEQAILPPSIPTGMFDSNGNPLNPPIVNCLTRTVDDLPSFRNGYVALIPKSNELIDKVGNMIRTTYGYQTKGWDSLEQLFEYTQSIEYNWDVCFAIELPLPTTANKYEYKLIFNNTGPPDRAYDDVPDTTRDITYEYKTEFKDPLFNLWWTSGFLSIQHYIDNLILKKETANPSAQILAKVYPFKHEAYTKDPIDLHLTGNFSPFVVLPMVLCFLRMTSGLLVEKEKKIREGMKIMGMSNMSFYLSWIIQYLIIYTVIALLMAFALKISVFQHSGYFFLFIWYWLFCISLIFQSLFVSSFFSRSKVGAIVAMLFYLFTFIIDFLFQNGEYSTAQYAGGSFLTQTGISRACEVIVVLEANGQGVDFDNADYKIKHFSVSIQMLMSLANIAFFAVMSLYLDQVLPNEFGKKKRPLFFLDYFCKKEKSLKLDFEEKNGENLDIEQFKQSDSIEEVTQVLKDQELRKEVLKMSNLKKIYFGRGKPFEAVSNLNLTMYKNQIFVLLGHNGAGKTTTISMLSGLLNITEGQAEVFGKDIQTDMEEIRKIMGICPQHDILFDNLTVKEHLELYAAFKGMNDSEKISAEVNKFIDDVDLREKTNVLSKNLSGGQRRRLSVAIAFIGGSQLIYLDEPTSGMDTSARRYIWDMLKQYRNNRIVILTTHFMDEADYLGDRIGIMGKGKLICCGSSEFLKERYGVGYNLTIVKESNNVKSDPIVEYIRSVIPSAHVLSNVSAEITIQLKNDSVSQFSQMFNGLDQNKVEFQIESYGISITTLEEVFLRVAEMDSVEKDKEEGNANKISNGELEYAKTDDQIDNFDLASVRIKSRAKLFYVQFLALLKKRVIYFLRDKRGLLCEIFIPFVVVGCGLAVTLINFITSHPPLLLEPSIYNTPLEIIYSGMANQSDMSTLMSHFNQADWKLDFFNTASLSQWDDQNFQLKSINRKGSYFINTIDNVHQNYFYEAEIQTISKDTTPLFVNQMNNAILKQATGNNNLSIQLTVNPFPNPIQVKNFQSTFAGIVAAFIFSIALSLIPASLITFTVKEREEKIKHQQLVSGVNLQSYWLSNFLVDLAKHLIPACLCILIVLAYNINTFSSGSNFDGMAGLFLLFGWSIIPFTYLAGFMFNNSGSAQVFAFFFNFVFGAILPILVLLLRIIKSTRSAAKVLMWIFRIFPSYCFGSGVVNIANTSLFATLEGKKVQPGVFELQIAGGDLMMLGIQGFVFYILIFIVEYFSNKKSMRSLIHKNDLDNQYNNTKFDSEVEKEMQQIAQSNPQDYTVRVKDLRKVYYADMDEPKVAVDRVSFGIKEGDCFGLLGINGAGKTTTFKILAGEIQPTSGSAHVKGYDLNSQMTEARQNIGYCPQFDALFENLTAREHLEFYSAIKGIPSELREGLITKKLHELGLAQFEHKCAGTYSGGNKRKLSVAIATLGNPPIVFLDEPSTGMDPEARRFMWNVISRISTLRKQSSIILTTHSMEEAEALCTRLTIMVNGTFKCLGTLTQIKNKYGQGYEVVIKTEIPQQKVQEILLNRGLDGKQVLQSLEEVQKIIKETFSKDSKSLIDQLSPEKSGKVLYQSLINKKGVTVEQLVEFVCIEEDGENIKKFIQQNLGSFIVIEHFSNLYRFKLTNTSNSIGKVFETFEKNKHQLNISSYNVRQATIEQIFNNFAEGKYEHEQEEDKSNKVEKIDNSNDKKQQKQEATVKTELVDLKQVFIQNSANQQ